jgi:alpha-L-rhamnosidase
VREAWRAAFVRDGGSRIGDDKQDDYVRALAFELLLPEQRAAAVDRLVELVVAADHHLGTGFLSTPMLLSVLADNGRADVAYRVLLQTTQPSWLGQIERGATTTWESWEGYDKKGNARYSHNHYAFGSVVSFLQEHVAGLSPAEPGYRRIRVAPVVGGGLTSASFAIDTPYGRAASAWHVDAGQLHLSVTVPGGAEAEILVGSGDLELRGPGQHEFSWPLDAEPPASGRIR